MQIRPLGNRSERADNDLRAPAGRSSLRTAAPASPSKWELRHSAEALPYARWGGAGEN